MKQKKWIPENIIRSSFGGGMSRSNPKEARPFSSSLAMHVVFKSSLAKGGLSFLQHKKHLDRIMQRQAKLHRIRIKNWQSIGGQIHILLEAKSRKRLQSFLRAFSGLCARYFLKAERGRPGKKSFCDYRPFSRVVNIDSKPIPTKDVSGFCKGLLLSTKKTRYIQKMNAILNQILTPI